MTRERLFKMMVGRELKDYFIKTDRAIGDVIFEVKNLGRKGKFRMYPLNFVKAKY